MRYFDSRKRIEVEMYGAQGAVSDLQCNFLRFISPREPNVCSGGAFAGRSKLSF